MTNIEKNGDLISGILLVAFSLFLIISTPYQVDLYEGSDALSPRLLPYVILSLIAVMGVILLVKWFIQYRTHKDTVAVKTDKEETSKRDLLYFITIPLFIILLSETIGFTFASIIGLTFGFYIFGVKPWYKAILPGILVPLAVEFIYRVLSIYLPLGFWEKLIY